MKKIVIITIPISVIIFIILAFFIYSGGDIVILKNPDHIAILIYNGSTVYNILYIITGL